MRIIDQMRQWLKDEHRDLAANDISDPTAPDLATIEGLPPSEVQKLIEDRYDGGVRQFIADSGPLR